jgi:protein involved in polysaccharide export with SLBB domain
MKMIWNMKLSGRARIVRISFCAAVFSLFFSTISPEVVQGQTQGQQMQVMQPQFQIFPVEQEIYKVKQKLDRIFIPEKEEFLSKLYRIPFPLTQRIISILQDLPDHLVPNFVKLIVLMKDYEIEDFISRLLYLPPAEAEKYILTKYKDIKEFAEISDLELFFSGYDTAKMKKAILRQVGYDISFWPVAEKPTTHFISSGYILGPGDSLFIYIWSKTKIPDVFNYPYSVTVLSDGKIFIPLVGPVAVGGLKIEQASELIRNSIRRVLGEVEVAISLSSIKSIPVLVMGEVRNPGVVIISGALSPFEAISKAGGIKKTGSLRRIEIKSNGKKVGEMDLYKLLFEGSAEEFSKYTLRAWDTIFVPQIGGTYAISGSVKREGIYEIKDKSTSLKSAIEYAGGFIPETGNFRIVVRRYKGEKKELSYDVFVRADELDKLESISIYDGDFIEVFSAVAEKVEPFVVISGYVKKPSSFPYFEGITLRDLVLLAGGFGGYYTPSGYEITIKEGKEEKTQKFPVERREEKDVEKVLEDFRNVKLKPFSRVTILPPPDEETTKIIQVEVIGEVKFPGVFQVKKGERLYDVLKRAGGFTDFAYPEGIVFTRESVRRSQIERVNLVSRLLAKEIISESTQQYVPTGQFPQLQRTLVEERLNILKYISEADIKGRVVVKVPRDLEKLRQSEYNIELEDGDKIYVPTVPNYVIVAGEVKSPTTFSYVPNKSAKFYINLAGGFTKYADEDEVFVIRANGEATRKLGKILPGDTIVIPPKIVIPYQTWYLVRDVLSLTFQGMSAAALMYSAIRR